MLKINDIATSKALDTKSMSVVFGGSRKGPSIDFDFGTRMDNRVADVSQMFGFSFDQTNAGQVTNNQAMKGGNGIVYAPVNQNLSQDNYLDVFGIGNTSVG